MAESKTSGMSSSSMNPADIRESPKPSIEGSIWMIAGWGSFLAWLFHSFAVRQFLSSLHVVEKILGAR